jgi:hypothetical protein
MASATIESGTPLARYEEFDQQVPPALSASPWELRDALLAMVAVEGPIVGHRLHSAYVQASGGRKVGKNIAATLNAAIADAVGQGLLVEDNPLHEPGVKPRTYRLSTQPPARVRQLGPREFEDIAPQELASMLTMAADRHGWDSDEILYRATLDMLGLKRLTTNVHARLAQVTHLARPD